MDSFLLLLLGSLIGSVGTLIGAGGGFLLVPILLFLYPHEPPERLTAISLFVVFANSFSGSIAYALKGRIDYFSGLLFAGAAIPGAILGVYSLNFIDRQSFNVIFGVVLFFIALYLLKRSQKVPSHNDPLTLKKDFPVYRPRLGMIFSFFIGILSSFLGIGGGILHVPFLVHSLKFPVHMATATSHFVLVITSFVAVMMHFSQGVFDGLWDKITFLAIGALLGAQIGARLSFRLNGRFIMKILSFALLLVALRLITLYIYTI